MAEDLTRRIAAIALAAADSATSPEATAAFTQVADRLAGPIRLAIAGKVKAGKSTLLNALIGEELAPTDAGECTRILTWYHYADRPAAVLHPRHGQPVERPYTRHGGALEVDLGDFDADQVDHLEIGWPTRRLDDLVLIDTPGIASVSAEVSERTHRALSSESGRSPVADAVLYLLRHMHTADIHFLEAFHDDEVAHGTPVNTVGVLARADEIGCSRIEAMQLAERVARRYESDPRLHRLCPVVVPVTGLLGHAAATLRESEYADLRAVAAAPPGEVEDVLLTVDRWVAGGASTPVPADRRAALLDRMGLFGVRLAVELIRGGAVRTSTDLAHSLSAVSGLERLRDVVRVQFESRARVLKARSAVAALQGLLETSRSREHTALLAELEEATASAHEFEEVRVLTDLRSGALDLKEDRAFDLDRLMGGSGHRSAVRLGLPEDTPPEEVRVAALSALRTWQGVERHPLSSRTMQVAARAAARSVEGILASLDVPPES